MTTISIAKEADEALLANLRSRAQSRLREIGLVRSGPNFLLASATHVQSTKQVLLTIARPQSPALAQLTGITALYASDAHPLIGTIVDRFQSDSSGQVFCVATTWHPDARPFEQVLVSGIRPPSGLRIIDALQSIADQLAAIHQRGFAHGDVSLANVLIDSANRVHLADFEHVTQDRVPFTDQAFFTPGYSHPGRLPRISSGNYTLAHLHSYDRYAFGKLILEVLSSADPYAFPDLSLLNQRALRLIACMLLDGTNTTAETALGLSPDFFREEQFRSLTDVVRAFSRLHDGYSAGDYIPELARVPERVVEVGALRPAPFTRRVEALLSTPDMQQLGSCMQLGLINFIWPTATHSRLEHSVGTYSFACEAVSNLYADPQSPFFRVLVGPKAARVLLAAALLHDVGHYPLAHDLEEAYGDAFDHEPRSVAAIQNGDIAKLLEQAEPQGWGVSAADVASVIEGTPLPGSTLRQWTVELLHSVMSGTLDVDKLDYLTRDSERLGVAAGAGIDLARILSALTIARVPKEQRRGKANSRVDALRLAVRAKGLRPAELVGRIRSHMFGVVYWHHTYRSIKAMIHWIVWMALIDPETQVANKSRSRAVVDNFMSELKSGDLLISFEQPAAASGSIPPREGAVLAKLVALGSGRAQALLSMLQQHRWYTAVLTVDHPDNASIEQADFDGKAAPVVDESEIWKLSIRLPVQADDAVTAKIRLARDVQGRVLEWFSSRSEGETGTTIERWDAQKVKFGLAANSEQLFLVDFVETRKSHEKKARELYFLAGERADAKTTDTRTSIPTRKSYDHHQLQSEFIASNGAIRLLCHPDFARFVTRSIPRNVLSEILRSALEGVTR